MKDQLTQYVSLLFVGATDAEEIHQEILQNTLDRYDDLIAQGKSPEAAYRLAISGIGDINEVLDSLPSASSHTQPTPQREPQEKMLPEDSFLRKLLRAIAIGLYILSPVPLFVLTEFDMSTLGLCGMFAIVAVATVLVLMSKKGSVPTKSSEKPEAKASPRQELRKSISGLIFAIGLVVYLVISFQTSAWHISWLVFPITGALQGLIKAILDLMEG